MAQRTVFVPEIGEVILSKRRGSTHIRLSINAAGKVRVGIPYWTPYQTGIDFAKSKAGWIQKNLKSHTDTKLQHGDLIGKSQRIVYNYQPSMQKILTRIINNQIIVSTSLSINDHRVQDKLQSACERALKAEAEILLPQRLKTLANKHDFVYKEVRIRKLTARWGSCSNKGVITLSYYLLQLPWSLIDYVILHELVHTRHLHHGKSFWDEFKRILPGAKEAQKAIRPYKPLVQAYHIIPNN
jgi:predicted metal-dependent hydrolase